MKYLTQMHAQNLDPHFWLRQSTNVYIKLHILRLFAPHISHRPYKNLCLYYLHMTLDFFLHCSSFSHLWEASDGIFYLHIYGSSIEFLNSNYFINYSTSIKSTQSQLWLFLANLHYSLLILFTSVNFMLIFILVLFDIHNCFSNFFKSIIWTSNLSKLDSDFFVSIQHYSLPNSFTSDDFMLIFIYYFLHIQLFQMHQFTLELLSTFLISISDPQT